MNDECIVRKLTADGDGSGDDRRYVSFVNNLFRLSRERDSVQALSSAARLKAMIDATEIAIRKQALLAATSKEQLLQYEQLVRDIDEHVSESVEKMREAKKELTVAKGIRRNKEQYELLAGMIQQIPSREETVLKLNSLKEDLEDLHEKQRKLEAKLVERRNHLHSFSIIIMNFNSFLSEEQREASNEEPMDALSGGFVGPRKDV